VILASFLLVCSLSTSTYGQFVATPNWFVGTWSTDFGLMSICQSDNSLYGGFETGYLVGTLQTDKRTIAGTIYFAGNTQESSPRKFRLSLDGNNTKIDGFIQSGSSSFDTVWTQVSEVVPSSTACRVPYTSTPQLTIEGHWNVTQVSGDVLTIDVCFINNGFEFEATSSDGFYYRGPISNGGEAGSGTLFSSIAPPAAYAYGGVLLSVIAGASGPELLFSRFSTDLGLVIQNGCNSDPLLACSDLYLTRSADASPGTCNSMSSLALWSGYWTYSNTNGQLVTRVIGNKVFGNYGFGIFEGTIDSYDPYLLSGIWFSASWTTNAYNDPAGKDVNYYGTFRIEMSPDGSSFSGTSWANNGQNGTCVDSTTVHCDASVLETRLPGFSTDPSAREVNGIDPLLSGVTTTGQFEIDGHFLDGVNKAYDYRCLYLNKQVPKAQPVIVQDKFYDDRVRTYATYTSFGCGQSYGIQRSAAEFGDQSIEPIGTTASEIWMDESGRGTQLVRRVSSTTLRLAWWYQNPGEQFPDLSFCAPDHFEPCSGVDSEIAVSESATAEQCGYCFSSAATAVASFALLIVCSLAVFF